MNGPQVKLSCVGNVFTRMMHFEKAGDGEQGHAHPFDHATLLSSGAIRLTVEGCSRDFQAPDLIFIPKDKVHKLLALQDNTVVACIHALRDAEGDILPESGIFSKEELVTLTELARIKE